MRVSSSSNNSKKIFADEKHYGGYLDEVLGTISFTLLVFFAGYFMNAPEIGFFAMFGLAMVIITSQAAQIEFPNKKEIARNFEENIFGKLKGRIGFPCAAQRILVSISVIFSSTLILLIFGILMHLFYILKFWIYRNH